MDVCVLALLLFPQNRKMALHFFLKPAHLNQKKNRRNVAQFKQNSVLHWFWQKHQL